MRKFLRKFFLFFGMIIYCALVQSGRASEIMTPADAVGIGRLNAVAYLGKTEGKLDIDQRGEYTWEYEFFAAKLNLRLTSRLHLYLRAGSISPELKGGIPTYTYKSKEEWTGNLFGGGWKWVLLPDTLVTPALALDIGYTQFVSKFNRKDDTVIDQELIVKEWQGAVLLSKRILILEPYLGVKFFSWDGEWKDNLPGAVPDKIEGEGSGYSPLAGLRFKLLPLVALQIEAGFADEKSIVGGLTVGF